MPWMCEITCSPIRNHPACTPVDGIDPDGIWHAAILLLCVAVLALSCLLEADETGVSVFGRRLPLGCWLSDTFGIKCALCGMSRSFCSLAHCDLAASLRYHRLGLAAFALFCLQIPYRACALAIHPRPLRPGLINAHRCLVVVLGAALVANWLFYLGGLLR